MRRVLRPTAAPRAELHCALAGVRPAWSSTGEVAGRARLAMRGASALLYSLQRAGLVEVTPAGVPPRWRLTERGAAELRTLAAKVAVSK